MKNWRRRASECLCQTVVQLVQNTFTIIHAITCLQRNGLGSLRDHNGQTHFVFVMYLLSRTRIGYRRDSNTSVNRIIR